MKSVDRQPLGIKQTRQKWTHTPRAQIEARCRDAGGRVGDRSQVQVLDLRDTRTRERPVPRHPHGLVAAGLPRVSAIALMATFLFMSTMFPTIFALGVSDA